MAKGASRPITGIKEQRNNRKEISIWKNIFRRAINIPRKIYHIIFKLLDNCSVTFFCICKDFIKHSLAQFKNDILFSLEISIKGAFWNATGFCNFFYLCIGKSFVTNNSFGCFYKFFSGFGCGKLYIASFAFWLYRSQWLKVNENLK